MTRRVKTFTFREPDISSGDELTNNCLIAIVASTQSRGTEGYENKCRNESRKVSLRKGSLSWWTQGCRMNVWVDFLCIRPEEENDTDLMSSSFHMIDWWKPIRSHRQRIKVLSKNGKESHVPWRSGVQVLNPHYLTPNLCFPTYHLYKIWAIYLTTYCLTYLNYKVGTEAIPILNFVKWAHFCKVLKTVPNTQSLSCFSGVRLFVTLWTVAHLACCPWDSSRQEYQSGLPFPQ